MAKKTKVNNKIKRTREDWIIDITVYVLLTILGVACFYPMWYVLCASVSNTSAILSTPGLLLWPEGFNLGAYELTFSYSLITTGYINTFIILALGLPINICLTLIAGYFMASPGMMFKKFLTWMMLFTMYFGGGLIPSYLNIDQLGLMDTYWALVLPGALSVYNAIICRTAVQAIPESLIEAAYMDGAGELRILFRIVTPLIVPTLAVLTLYYGVAHWNSWFSASIYLKSNLKLPLQNVLRSILLENDSGLDSGDNYNQFAESIKYSTIIVSTAPIIAVYPFIQRFFVKGVMIGAVKG